MKRLVSILGIIFALVLLVLGIFEISFPEIFSWVTVFEDRYPKLYRWYMEIGIGEVLMSVPFLWLSRHFDQPFFLKALETSLRLGIGGMFVFAAYYKIVDPHTFAVLVAQYQFLPHNLVNSFSLLMPMAEVLVGVSIILLPFTKENAMLLVGMFLSFIVALSFALWNDLGITCGCFAIEGAQDKTEAWTALVRDLILIGPTAWLVTRKNQTLWSLWRTRD